MAVQLFSEHELAAVHPRLHHAGARPTVRDRLPPEAQAWQRHDPQWCLAEAKRIGAACHPVILALSNDEVLVNFRGAQGILRLDGQGRYGSTRSRPPPRHVLKQSALSNYQDDPR